MWLMLYSDQRVSLKVISDLSPKWATAQLLCSLQHVHDGQDVETT